MDNKQRITKKDWLLGKSLILKVGILVFSFFLIWSLLPETIFVTRASASEAVKLNKTKVTIEVGKTYILKISKTKEKVTWSTSNIKIAKVNKSGKVTGVKKGTATITATVGGKKYTCKVTVKQQEYKVASSGLIEVRTHQEIMNDFNMTVIKTSNKIYGLVEGEDIAEGDGFAMGTPIYEDIPNLVEIKWGYFTDKNKNKYYIIAVTNISRRAFEDGDILAYSSEEDTEAWLQLKYIQPGETSFYLFGNSNKEQNWGYIDYNYFKNLNFTYSYYAPQEEYKEIYKDIRDDFKIQSKEDKYTYGDGTKSGTDLYMVVKGDKFKDNVSWAMALFYLDEKGKLIEVEYNHSYSDKSEVYIRGYDGKASKVIVAVNHIIQVQ